MFIYRLNPKNNDPQVGYVVGSTFHPVESYPNSEEGLKAARAAVHYLNGGNPPATVPDAFPQREMELAKGILAGVEAIEYLHEKFEATGHTDSILGTMRDILKGNTPSFIWLWPQTLLRLQIMHPAERWNKALVYPDTPEGREMLDQQKEFEEQKTGVKTQSDRIELDSHTYVHVEYL